MGKASWAGMVGLGALLAVDQVGRAELRARSTSLATRAGPVEVEVTGDGGDVLILHGTFGGFDQGTWLARALDLRGHRAIAVSRPGYLGTPDRPSLDAAVELCVATLDALEVRRAAVIGVSGGGMTASTLAMRRPDRVSALVMLSAVSGHVTEIGWRLALYFARTSIDLNAAVLSALPVPARRGLLAGLALSFTAPDRRVVGALRDASIMRSFAAPQAVRVPALVVHGTADHAVPFAHAERTVAGCARGELVGIEGGGHLACLTHPMVGERIRAFLASPPS